MPKYVISALEKLNHSSLTKPQDTPHPWVPIKYGKQTHLTSPDTSSKLPANKIRHIQRIVGTFL